MYYIPCLLFIMDISCRYLLWACKRAKYSGDELMTISWRKRTSLPA